MTFPTISIWEKIRLKATCLILASAFVLSGCSAIPIRTSQRYPSYFNSPRSIMVMPVDIKAYKLSAGGIPEEMDEWESLTRRLFNENIKAILGAYPDIKLSFLDESSFHADGGEFLRSQKGLYECVAQSIISHTYVPAAVFPLKKKNFDYTLGPEIGGFSGFSQVDSLLFVNGMRTYWTGGRILLAAWGVLLGAATGTVIMPGSVPDWICLSLVDVASGDVIWFRFYGDPDNAVGDLRRESVVRDTLDYCFRDFRPRR